jgi:alpha-D-ribose 1-methylphosphonate 5-triphosphate synthase subunit PhnH
MNEALTPSSSHDHAKIFRMILDAMSHPGRIVEFKTPPLKPPLGVSAEMAALVFTLCDFQSPIWMASKTAEIVKFVKFHSGAAFTDVLADATFVISSAPEKLPFFEDFAQGTHEYPDRSSTLILQVADLTNSGNIVLKGPGIAAQTVLKAAELDDVFWHNLSINHARYPLGVDVIFVAKGKIAAIPRSTHIQIMAQQ